MLTPKEAWQATLGQLQVQLTQSTFETWLKGSEVLAYEDGDFTIRVRHAYAKDWLDKHLKSQVVATLGKIFQRSVQVNFVVYLPNRQREHPGDIGPMFDNAPPPAQDTGIWEETLEEVVRKRIIEYAEWDPRFSNVERSRPDSVPLHQLPLDRRYTFDTFVTGPSNHFAYAAAHSVADNPGKQFNPLVIYGGVGLGKTHLLQAIGHLSEAGGRNVAYLTAESFTNELVEAIRAQETEDFRERYRNIDMLLLDDIQFMAGKTSIEEEFYHTFNEICSLGGQIVIACHHHPRQIEKLDERLRSRMEGGLLADLQPPEFETRLAIVINKAEAQDSPLPDDVASLLAHHASASVRELEGLLNQVIARAVLMREPLTIELAQQIIQKNNLPTAAAPRRRARSKITEVLEATATYHQLSLDELLGQGRSKKLVRARQIAMYLAREETDASLPQIGDALGGRAHSTVLHGCQKIADTVGTDAALRRELSDIRGQLHLFANA
jgi:chromosomal replication initiator protein